jgi:hypothetical protein
VLAILLMLSRSDDIVVEVSDGDGNVTDCASALYVFEISASNAVFRFCVTVL